MKNNISHNLNCSIDRKVKKYDSIEYSELNIEYSSELENNVYDKAIEYINKVREQYEKEKEEGKNPKQAVLVNCAR